MSSTSPAVGKALDVLRYLATRTGPVSVAAIVRDLDLARSSAYHVLEVLVDKGFVVHFADDRTYGLGVASIEIGSAYLRHEPLEMLARPILKRLVVQVKSTAHLGVLHGAETLYLLKEQPPVSQIPVTLVTDVGVRLPAHLTASGRAILAHLQPSQVRALFGSKRAFVDRTGAGPVSLPQLRKVLQEERRRGWSQEVGLVTDGLESVAACAFDHGGRPVAAFSVTRRQECPKSAVGTDRLVWQVRRAAQALTTALSGRAPVDWFDDLTVDL